MDGQLIRGWRFALLTGAVCVLGGLVAWFMGLLAMLPYVIPYSEQPEDCAMADRISLVGMSAGGGSGVLVALVWCWIMRARAARGTSGLVKHGGLWGIAAGVVSTLILHAALRFTATPSDPVPVLAAIGLAFGVVSGLVLGLICGLMFKRLVTPAKNGAATSAPATASEAGD